MVTGSSPYWISGVLRVLPVEVPVELDERVGRCGAGEVVLVDEGHLLDVAGRRRGRRSPVAGTGLRVRGGVRRRAGVVRRTCARVGAVGEGDRAHARAGRVIRVAAEVVLRRDAQRLDVADVGDAREVDVVRDLVGVRADPAVADVDAAVLRALGMAREVDLRELGELREDRVDGRVDLPAALRRVRRRAVIAGLVAERVVLHGHDVVRAVAVARQQRRDVGEVVARAVRAVDEHERPQRLVAVRLRDDGRGRTHRRDRDVARVVADVGLSVDCDAGAAGVAFGRGIVVPAAAPVENRGNRDRRG